MQRSIYLSFSLAFVQHIRPWHYELNSTTGFWMLLALVSFPFPSRNTLVFGRHWNHHMRFTMLRHELPYDTPKISKPHAIYRAHPHNCLHKYTEQTAVFRRATNSSISLVASLFHHVAVFLSSGASQNRIATKVLYTLKKWQTSQDEDYLQSFNALVRQNLLSIFVNTLEGSFLPLSCMATRSGREWCHEMSWALLLLWVQLSWPQSIWFCFCVDEAF